MASKPIPKVRLTVDVTEDLNDRLSELASGLGGSKSDLLRKAIGLVEVAVRAKQQGRDLAVVDENQKVVTTIVGL